MKALTLSLSILLGEAGIPLLGQTYSVLGKKLAECPGSEGVAEWS